MTREKLWTALAKKLETKSLAARTRPSSHWTYSDKTQRSTLNLLQKRYRSMWTQQPGKQIGIAAERTKQWVEKYPRETAGIIACIVAAPLGIAAAHGLLYMVGFMAAGVAAGSTAAAAQAGIGSVAAGSTFAVLQSAAAGGAGAVLVNGIATGTATGIAVAATVPGVIKAMQEGKKEVIIDDVTYKIDDKAMEELSPEGQ